MQAPSRDICEPRRMVIAAGCRVSSFRTSRHLRRTQRAHLESAVEARDTLRQKRFVGLRRHCGGDSPTSGLLAVASVEDATVIRAILSAAVKTDVAARRAFEAAVADIAANAPAGEGTKEFGIDAERLERYMRKRFPDQGAMRVRSVTRLPGGHSKESPLRD